MPENEKPIIFISHADEDKEIASALGTLIDDAFIGYIGHWFSSDKRPSGGIRPGKDWNQDIHDHLRGAKWAFILITPTSIDRQWVIWEAGVASQACPDGVVPIAVGMKWGNVPAPLSFYNGVDGLDSKALCTALQKIADSQNLSPRHDVLLQACKRFVKKAATLAGTVKDAEAEILDDRGLVTKGDLRLFAERLEERLAKKIGRMATPEPLVEPKKATKADPEIETAARQLITLQDAGATLEVDVVRSLMAKLYESGEFAQALVLGQYVMSSEQAASVDFSNMGILLQRSGRLEEAQDAYWKAIELSPKYALVWNNLGNLLSDTGRMKEAEDAYRKAIELDPKFAIAWNNLGNLLGDTGRMKEAEDAYRKAIELGPKLAMAYNNLGNLLKATRRMKEGEHAYRKAIKLDPKGADAWNNLGNLLSDNGRMKEAEDAYRKAIELDPKGADAWSNLGNLLRDTGRMKEAEDAHGKALEIEPDSADRHNSLAYFLWGAGRWEEAEMEVREALRINSDCSYAHATLGLLHFEKNDLQGGRKGYERAIELRPHDLRLRQKFHFEYGRVLARDGRQEDARREFVAGLKFDTDFVRKEIEADLKKLG